MSGSVAVSLAELPGAVAQVLRGQNDSLAASLVELRATRALMAFATGGALALAGVMMQALLRNPLADPYVLGISAGAAVGALFALLMMCAAATVDAAAIAGAVAISLLLYLLARRDLKAAWRRRRHIAAAADRRDPDVGLHGAGHADAVDRAGKPPAQHGVLDDRRPGRRAPGACCPGSCWLGRWLFALRNARALNVLALHAEAAATLGIRVGALRKGLFFVFRLLTASAVTTAGRSASSA
jgi:iron complex transport system permease protein